MYEYVCMYSFIGLFFIFYVFFFLIYCYFNNIILSKSDPETEFLWGGAFHCCKQKLKKLLKNSKFCLPIQSIVETLRFSNAITCTRIIKNYLLNVAIIVSVVTLDIISHIKGLVNFEKFKLA